ncbi:trigger factor, partial [Candidatus Saccharibacteria bacterium]|nr:trigger factor [Candidatus Saccharibacteria bacterium]
LEFEVITEVVGKIKLADYKKIKLAKEKAAVVAKDVEDVIKSLKKQVADKKEVQREAKTNDEVWIDFKGVDAKGEPVNGADGKDYPLVLGSKTFIPGFEENIEGLKPGEEKTFTLTFPKDYGVKALANKKVTFTVTVKKIQEIEEPEVNDTFAGKVGPFKTLKDLKDDIKKQLTIEKQNELERKYQNELVGKIAEKSEVAIPDVLIEQQMGYNLDEVKRNLTYRGQTYQEFLEAEGLTDEQYKETILKPQATQHVKISLILSEIAEAEQLLITPEELEIRIQLLKGQYQDPAMQANLDKPENRSDIASRMLTEKVLSKLQEYATK